MSTCLTCIHARQLKRPVAASALCSNFNQTVLLNWMCSEFSPLNGHFELGGVDGARTARNEVRTERAHGEAANFADFDTASDRRKKHQRRCSTADESGLPDYGV